MSEENRNEAGQFAPTPEPLFGKEGIERDQGYVPFKEESTEEPEELTLAEAAEGLTESRTPEGEVKTYSALDDLPENVTLTIDQAVKIQSDLRAADEAETADAEAESIRKQVDELRGVDPEAKADPAETDVEKFFKIPEVKEALQKRHTEVETAYQAYSQGVNVANDFARASFIENFPEIASLPVEQWEGALVAMSQQEPERFNKAVGTLQRVVQLQTAQQQQQQQKAFAEEQELKAYAQAESARFEESIKGVSKQDRRAVEDSIVEAIKEYGGDTAEFFELMKTNKLMNSAVAQRILWAAGKYHQIQKAPKAISTKGLPPVLRPGTSNGARASSPPAQIAALEKSLATATGDNAARISAKIWGLQKRARG